MIRSARFPLYNGNSTSLDVAVSDTLRIGDVQSGSQHNHNSHKTLFRHEAAPIKPPPFWPSSPAPNMGPPMPAVPSSKPNAEPFRYSHKMLVPVDLCIPPAIPACLPTPPPLSRAQEIPSHYTAPVHGTDDFPPIPCNTISNEDFENVMAAMGDIYHPSSIAATQVNFSEPVYKNGLFYMPQEDPTWFQTITLPFEECPGYIEAQPQYSHRG